MTPQTILLPEKKPYSANPRRIDLHCHSEASCDGAEAVLDAIGCPECYSKPQDVYDQATRRGMDFVTITDHDSIKGVERILDRSNVLVGEELTCWFPEDGCKMHVLIWGITPADHAALQGKSKDIYACAEYIENRRIAHAVAHPLYRQNDKLEKWHLERLILMFKGFECLNGAHSALHRTAFEPVLNGLSRQAIQELSEKHGMLPRWPEPWFKARTAGSDDHGLLNIGRTWTEFPAETETIDDVLQCLREGTCMPGGEAGSSIKLAHNFYSVAVRFFGRQVMSPDKTPNLATQLMQTIVGERRAPGKAKLAALAVRHGIKSGARRVLSPFKRPASDGAGILNRLFTRSAKSRFRDHPRLREVLGQGLPPLGEHEDMFRLVSGMNSDVTRGLFDAVANAIGDARFTGVFDCLAAAVAQQFVLMPYYFALFHQNRERDVLHRITGHNPPPTESAMRVGLFTDTFDESNAVARMIRGLSVESSRADRLLMIHTCVEHPTLDDARRKNFSPMAAWPLPHVADLPVAVPPVLEILEWADRQQFDAICIATPGPMGMCGWLAAKMLKVPVIGIHAIDLPGEIERLVDEMRVTAVASTAMGKMYKAMSAIAATGRGEVAVLKAAGVPDEKIVNLPAGVDHDLFHPNRRDVNIWVGLSISQPRRLLYAGPFGADKELPLLIKTMRLLCNTRLDVALIVTADGPAVSLLKTGLSDLPAYFVLPVSDEQTATIYSSADLLIAPSAAGSPWRALLEAQAAGLPVLAGRGGAAEEFMTDGVTGLTLSAAPDQAANWAVAINRLLDDEPCRQRMSRNAHHRAGRFSRAKTFDALWGAHAKVVNYGPLEQSMRKLPRAMSELNAATL